MVMIMTMLMAMILVMMFFGWNVHTRFENTQLVRFGRMCWYRHKNTGQPKYTQGEKHSNTQEHTDTNMHKQTKLTHSLRVLGVAKCGKSGVEASIWVFPKQSVLQKLRFDVFFFYYKNVEDGAVMIMIMIIKVGKRDLHHSPAHSIRWVRWVDGLHKRYFWKIF